MADEPRVQIVRGSPDEIELAALVAGLAAHEAEAELEATAGEERADAWSDRRTGLRGVGPAARRGPDAWRWSLRG